MQNRWDKFAGNFKTLQKSFEDDRLTRESFLKCNLYFNDIYCIHLRLSNIYLIVYYSVKTSLNKALSNDYLKMHGRLIQQLCLPDDVNGTELKQNREIGGAKTS